MQRFFGDDKAVSDDKQPDRQPAGPVGGEILQMTAFGSKCRDWQQRCEQSSGQGEASLLQG